jgi:branched-chain amino acid transport system ATP-binding protein
MGLAPKAVTSLFDVLKLIPTLGASVLLVEQNAAEALQIAHRAYVLEQGQITADGTADELRSDERIRQAYLGV